MMSTAIYLRPDESNKPLIAGSEWPDLIRYGFEIGTVCGVLSYILVQQGGEIKNQGIVSFTKQLVGIWRYELINDSARHD